MSLLFRSRFDKNQVPNVDSFRSSLDYLPEGEVDLIVGRLECLIEKWCEIYDLIRGSLIPNADVEDWVENAVVLITALNKGVFCRTLNPKDSILEFIAQQTPRTDSPKFFFFGHFTNMDQQFFMTLNKERDDFSWPRGGRIRRAEKYWQSSVLIKALGRPAVIASGDSNGKHGYIEGVRHLLNRDVRHIMSKVIAKPKYAAVEELPLSIGDESANVSSKMIKDAFFELYDYNMMELCHYDSCFLLQEKRQLGHEYRIVVVNGKPVAGSGCIEYFSPIFHDPNDGYFDPWMEARRNDKKPARNSMLASNYRDFVQELCEKLHRESNSERFRDAVFDVALDKATNDIVLVEVNPIEHFGFYALDFGRVLDAVIDLDIKS